MTSGAGTLMSRPSLPAITTPRTRVKLVMRIDERSTHENAFFDAGPRARGLVHERRVQVAPGNRQSIHSGGVLAAHQGPPFTSEEHAVNRSRARFEARRQVEASQHGQRPGVDRVAAQLVSGKAGTIDEKHARAGTREDGRRHAASRTRAGNDDVKHVSPWSLVVRPWSLVACPR